MRNLNGFVVVHCPICGNEIKFTEIPLESVIGYNSSYLSVRFGDVSVKHECDFGPDTDGLTPIERFVKKGGLDDQGRPSTIINNYASVPVDSLVDPSDSAVSDSLIGDYTKC